MDLHPRVAAAAEGVLPPWARVGPKRLEHMGRVADLMARWSEALELPAWDQARWRAAGWLHDALREADPEELRPCVPASLRDLPAAVLHGPAASERLRGEGVGDEAFLLAVAYHTLGHGSLDRLGRALYAADFLDPGRSFLPEQRASLRSRMPGEFDAVVRDVVRLRIGHLLGRGVRLGDATVEFWNALADGLSAGVPA